MNSEPSQSLLASAATFNLGMARTCAVVCADAYQGETVASALAHCLIERSALAIGGEPATIIAFRGSAALVDWVTDFRIARMNLGFASVHEGFWRSAQSVTDRIADYAGALQPLVVTGHSKGAAEAILCAWLLARRGYPVAAVYTFGGPRVGDARFAARYNETGTHRTMLATAPASDELTLGDVTFRVVDEEDIVPRVPLALMGNRHVKQEVFFPTFGGWKIGAPLWFKLASDVIGTYCDWKRGKLAQIADHPIGKYIKRLEAA